MLPNLTRNLSGNLKRLGLLLGCLLLLNLALFGFVAWNAGGTHTANAATTYKVLFDASHAETAGNADWIISTSQPNPLNQNANPQVETDWTGAMSAWGVALQKTGRYSLMTIPSGGRITYGDSTNALDLKNFNEFVVPEPNVLFSASEKTAIMTFVQNGGGLFMIADHNQSDRNNDGYDSLHIWNDLMSNNTVNSTDPFGFSFDVLNIATENPNGIPASASTNPVIHGPFGTVTGGIIRNGTTETINPTDNSNVTGLVYRTGFSTTGTTGVFFLTSKFGAGRVAAWGDSSDIDDGTGEAGKNLFNGWDDPAATDAALALNATEWLAQGGTSTSPTPTATNVLPTPTATNAPTPTATNAPTPTATKAPTPTATNAPTPTATPTPIGGSQLIVNGGFESGTSPWTQSSSGGYQIIDTAKPHSGTSGADLCGYNNCTDSIYQTVSIPASVSSASLSYYTYITTQETSHPYDFFNAQVRNTSGTVLKTLQTLNDGSPTGSWVKSTFDVTAYKGQTVQIYFSGTNDSSNPTEFYLDDVSLTTSTSTTTPTATATVPPTATAVPPTATVVPPTATVVPPTATAVPPTATVGPTATPPSSQQLIVNGGFESGTSPWTQSSSGGYQLIDTAKPHTGTSSADLCGYNNCTDTIYQTISIPSTATTVTLSFYVYITTQETSHPYDFLNVQIRNSSGAVLATAKQLSDGSSTNSWVQYTYSLGSYKGQTVQIYFGATNDSSNPTEFYVDDVSVTAQ